MLSSEGVVEGFFNLSFKILVGSAGIDDQIFLIVHALVDPLRAITSSIGLQPSLFVRVFGVVDVFLRLLLIRDVLAATLLVHVVHVAYHAVVEFT